MADDVLDTHLALGAVAVERKPVDQADRFGVERVYLQLLFDLRAALLGRDDTLELGATVIGRRRAGLHIRLDELVAA